MFHSATRNNTVRVTFLRRRRKFREVLILAHSQKGSSLPCLYYRTSHREWVHCTKLTDRQWLYYLEHMTQWSEDPGREVIKRSSLATPSGFETWSQCPHSKTGGWTRMWKRSQQHIITLATRCVIKMLARWTTRLNCGYPCLSLFFLITNFAAVFSPPCDFHRWQNKCYHFVGMDQERTLPRDRLITQLIFSVVVQIECQEKQIEKRIK